MIKKHVWPCRSTYRAAMIVSVPGIKVSEVMLIASVGVCSAFFYARQSLLPDRAVFDSLNASSIAFHC